MHFAARTRVALRRAGALVACACALVAARSLAAPKNPNPASAEWVYAQHPDRVRLVLDNLDLDRRELVRVKRAIDARDYPGACNALVAYYRDAPTMAWLRKPAVSESKRVDARADRVLADDMEYYGEKARVPRKASGGLDWSYAGPNNDNEWRFALNRMWHVNFLMVGYLKTGRRAYAQRADQDLRDWILANPYPGRQARDGAWRGLETSIRVTNWAEVFYGLQRATEFTTATRILVLSAVVEHARYLRQFHRDDANNAMATEMTALGTIGCAWPEFREASDWRSHSQEKMDWLVGELVYPDGAEIELSSWYHRTTTGELDKYVDTFRRSDYPVPDSIAADVQRMWSYLAYTMRPDGTSPQTNDSDRDDVREKLVAAAKAYGRPDWTYIATHGREGKRPEVGPTVVFPWAGHAVMRSGWSADAHWSFFDAGPFGVAHPHYDKLHLSIDAFGRPLLVDAGRFDYAKGPFRDYFVGSASHNVLLIDGAGQNATAERAEHPWEDHGSTPDLDYARAVFDAGYRGVRDRVVHARTVVYVRNRFWIVVDRVETDRPHRVDALWHFAPDCRVALQGRSAVSVDAGLGNLRVAPVGPVAWNAELVAGREKPVQGWYSAAFNAKAANPTAIYSARIGRTTTFAWVLVPARGDVPAVDARVVSSRDTGTELRVQTGTDSAIVVVIPTDSSPPSVRPGG